MAAAAVAALAVVGLPSAAQAAEGDRNDRNVEQRSVDVLLRPAARARRRRALQSWTDRLNAGDGRLRIRESVESSQEFADNTVEGYDEEHLDRRADHWKDGVRADMEPEWVEQNVLGSQELADRSGRDPVDERYPTVLGRPGGDAANRARRSTGWPLQGGRLPRRAAGDLSWAPRGHGQRPRRPR